MAPLARVSARRVAELCAAGRGLAVRYADRSYGDVVYTDDASEQGGAVVLLGREVLAWISPEGDAHLEAGALVSAPAVSTMEAAPVASLAA